MELNEQLKKYKIISNNAMYNNTRKINTIQKMQSVVLDLDLDLLTESNTRFSVTLQEPLKIDSLSDIFLSNFTTYDTILNTTNYTTLSPSTHVIQPNSLITILKIDQFNIKNSSNDTLLWDKLIIPNVSTSASGTFDHKSKKNNYVCSINPTVLTNITGTITNQALEKIHATANSRAIIEFVIVSRE